ncbi:hypothetical protein [Hymenobacter metallicola]|uniref:Uncharacterized protein n=1 Tax=Hymenobacter metallicola TaxID=2563114 RepID=A0A4Z0QID1_9BACT|nr:hypothetical protein [Hymenobacter metallicola]TGE29838.1 hypothetical protein E5K02_10365 [Hymenobacter metallicola]
MSDCTNCHKDFCDCTRESSQAARVNAADWRAFRVVQELNKAKVCYKEAPTENVVIILKLGKPDVYLSLKPAGNQYKYRIKGRKWAKMDGREFMERIAKAYTYQK